MRAPWKVNVEVTSDYIKWFDSFDNPTKSIIDIRIVNVRNGNPGKYRNLGDNLCEFKWDSGLRVYFGKIADSIVLLWGGKKSKQKRDIKRAQRYWNSYRKREA